MPCIQAIGQCYPNYEFTPETFEKLYCSDKFPYDEKIKEWVRKLVHNSGIETIPSSVNPAQFDEPALPYDPVSQNSRVTAMMVYSFQESIKLNHTLYMIIRHATPSILNFFIFSKSVIQKNPYNRKI